MSTELDDSSDEIRDLEQKIFSYCNLIPVDTWGFDETVKESINLRKHSLVNRQLSKKERKQMSSVHKQQLARGLGLVPNTVEEVMSWMSKSKELSKVQPTKNPILKAKVSNEAKLAKLQISKKNEKEEEKESEDSDESNEDEPKIASSDDEEDSDDDQEDDPQNSKAEPNLNGTIEESSDEDEEPVIKKPKVEAKKPKTNDKIDVEIQKLEEDENNEAPEIKRQIALLRLQKKLKEMKDDRKGATKTKTTLQIADKLREEKKLKRRESKLKLKQRRAEEKKKKENGSEIKQEKPIKQDVDNESKGQTNGKKMDIAFNTLKFEIKEDSRGKKQRTAKKDRKLKLTGRDYKSLIAKVEETKATIEKVREADPHKATIMEDELKWEKTMKRAAGGKVKDNLELLKKALNKKNKLKEKKKEKWNNRVNKLDNEKQTKQEKRKANLQKRIDTVKAKKLARLRKKGRVL